VDPAAEDDLRRDHSYRVGLEAGVGLVDQAASGRLIERIEPGLDTISNVVPIRGAARVPKR